MLKKKKKKRLETAIEFFIFYFFFLPVAVSSAGRLIFLFDFVVYLGLGVYISYLSCFWLV